MKMYTQQAEGLLKTVFKLFGIPQRKKRPVVPMAGGGFLGSLFLIVIRLAKVTC